MIKKKFDLGYPTKAHGKIPSFHNIEEEADFWDTHNIFTYEEIPAGELFELNKPREASMIFRLQTKLKKALEKFARSKGLNPSALVRMWVTEKLQEEVRIRNFSATRT